MYVKVEDQERRCLPTAELRLDTAKGQKITGYAAVFNTWADIGGWFRESIKPGAFGKTIRENDVRALLNHDPNFVLGRNKAGTLRLREDSKGLAVEIDPTPTTWANDLLVSMRRGDVTQMSFGFTVNKQQVDYDKDERVLEDVTLFDVSVVTYPAYPTTSAEVRTAFATKKTKDELQEVPELDRIFAKIKAGESLTEDEQRAISIYVPTLSAPVANHAGTQPEPVANHSASDTRGQGPSWISLLAKVDKHYAKETGV